ncbi:hypothetical protein DVW08_06590 [Clostridium botulinum]|nr:hypothetical protein [Clostridium botulinum]
MEKKFMISDEDYERLAKYLAIGCGTGIFLGAIIGYIEFLFALGSVVGVLSSQLNSIMKKHNDNKN